jgi:hypothetical protein
MSELRCLLADNRLVRRKPNAKAKPKTKAPPPPMVVESVKVELPSPARAAIEEQAVPAKKRTRNRKGAGSTRKRGALNSERARELAVLLRELAPAVFCEPPRPLVVGIAAEVHALVAGTYPHWPISHALWA